MKKVRTVIFYKKYFEKFYQELEPKVKDKFVWTFELIAEIQNVPDKYLKHVENGIYEVRVKFGTNIYRAFGFFDGNKLIIVINGFIKKTQKTPKNEIKKAIKIREEYEDEK